MSTISIIVLTITLLSVVVSFVVLLKTEKKSVSGNDNAVNIRVVPSYNGSVKKMLEERGVNTGEMLPQEQLLDKTDYVLDAF